MKDKSNDDVIIVEVSYSQYDNLRTMYTFLVLR